jgi:hypothetical protein
MHKNKKDFDRPFADSKVAKFMTKRIDELGKPNREIAQLAGFTGGPNIISMIKNGDVKLPLERVVPMARALGADPKSLMRMALEQYMPFDKYPEIASVLSDILSDNEREILEFIRDVAGENAVPGLNDHRRKALKDAFAAL